MLSSSGMLRYVPPIIVPLAPLVFGETHINPATAALPALFCTGTWLGNSTGSITSVRKWPVERPGYLACCPDGTDWMSHEKTTAIAQRSSTTRSSLRPCLA